MLGHRENLDETDDFTNLQLQIILFFCKIIFLAYLVICKVVKLGDMCSWKKH